MQTRFDKQDRLYQSIRLIRPIHLNMQRTLEAQLEGTGISVAQRDLLEVFHGSGPLTVPTASRFLGAKRQFVQRTVSDLLGMGLVERRASPRSPRTFLYKLTDAGRRLFETVHEREMALLRHRLGDINITEIVVALRVMARIAGAFESAATDAVNAAPPPPAPQAVLPAKASAASARA